MHKSQGLVPFKWMKDSMGLVSQWVLMKRGTLTKLGDVLMKGVNTPTDAVRCPGIWSLTQKRGPLLLLPVHMLLPPGHIHCREVFLTHLTEEQPLLFQAVMT